jgi:hypothetical protein
VEAIPDETTILKFRHLLERQGLAGALLEEINALLGERGLILRKGTMVDATLIAAPTSTKNAQGKRDPEMSSTKKGNQWCFGMKAHVGVDTAHGLVHTVVGTAAKVPDVKVTDTLLHGEEHEVHGDKGYTTRERNLTASDPASGPLWCFPFKRQRGRELPEWKHRDQSSAVAASGACGASVSGHQASVWIHQGARPGAGQEHGASEDTVCAVESVPGEAPVVARDGIGAPGDWGLPAQRAENTQECSKNRPELTGGTACQT